MDENGEDEKCLRELIETEVRTKERQRNECTDDNSGGFTFSGKP